MKKTLCLTLALLLALALTACADAKPTQLGTSAFSIVLPKGYAPETDDLDEDQIAFLNEIQALYLDSKKKAGKFTPTRYRSDQEGGASS